MKPETHPLPPFFPAGTKYLFLGSFPPKRERWCMEFYYPNFQNDMWRIFGVIFFGDKNHFVNAAEKHFERGAIEAFLAERRIGVYDAARVVIRHSDNASDKDLEVVEAADIVGIVRKLPELESIVATGQKALDTITEQLAKGGISISPPAVGSYTAFCVDGRDLRLYRMPSSSRAYPLALEKKAGIYNKIFFGEIHKIS